MIIKRLWRLRNTWVLKRQLRQAWIDYQMGRTRPIEELFAELDAMKARRWWQFWRKGDEHGR